MRYWVVCYQPATRCTLRLGARVLAPHKLKPIMLQARTIGVLPERSHERIALEVSEHECNSKTPS